MTEAVEVDLDIERFKKQTLDLIEENAPTAGKYVVDQARRKLRAIEEPKWGLGYRRKVVSDLLDFEVKREENGITLLVGVKKTADSEHHGFYIEVGSKSAPAHPFIRPAIFENGLKILQLLIRRPKAKQEE